MAALVAPLPLVGAASKAEKEFRQRFPYANVRAGVTHPFEVYAGDYLCSEGRTRKDAFAEALRYVDAGIITPDPMEVSLEVE